MEFLQIFTAIAFILHTVCSQNLGRTVTTAVPGCTGAVKKFVGAQPGETVRIHYSGFLGEVNGGTWKKGKKFDSSLGGDPISFTLGNGRVIKGWEDGLIGTCEGESLRLEIPPSLGYGDQDVGDGLIPANSNLIFELTLVKLEKSFDDLIETLEVKQCSSDAKSRDKDKVTFDYEGSLPDGTIWGLTDKETGPLGPIEIGNTGLKGWDLGLTGMCKGERRRLYLPASLAYGDVGIVDGDKVLVPPNSVVIIDITLIDIANRVDNFLQAFVNGQLGDLFGR